MYAKLNGATLHDIDGCIITVEVDISQGLPVFDIVGLPNQSVKEARERVRAAIKNSGYEFPMRRIVVNLAPARWFVITDLWDSSYVASRIRC